MRMRRFLGGASALALALTISGGWSAHAKAEDCTLPPAICAEEGIVILGPHADPLTSWEKSTDFLPLEVLAGEAFSTIDRLGAEQAVALILGHGDLVTRGYDQLIHAVVGRGGAVVVTDPAPADAQRLDRVAGIRGARWGRKEDARLYGVREALAGDGRTYPTAFVLLSDAPNDAHPRHRRSRGWIGAAELGETELAWLERLIGRDPPTPIRKAVASPAEAVPADAPSSNDLIDLVQAKHTSVLRTQNEDSVQLDNFIYGARSFLNNEDLYYVDQEIQFAKVHKGSMALLQSYSANLPTRPGASRNTMLLRPSPETTLKTTTYTTGVNFSIGGNTGYFAGPGAGANVSSSLSYTNSSSTTVPPLNLIYRPSLPQAESHWIITENTNSGANTILLQDSWIWAVPLAAYTSEQEDFVFESTARMRAGFLHAREWVYNDFSAHIENLVDQPFPTKTILPPSIATVTPNAVPRAGQVTISGQGLYPGLFANVLLGGNALPAANVTNTSDTQIVVTVPNNPSSFPLGVPLAVQANTSAGASNNNNTLTILRVGTDQASLAQPAEAPQ